MQRRARVCQAVEPRLVADHELDVALEARSSGEAVVVAVLAFGVAGLLAGVEGAVIVRVFGGGGGGWRGRG